MRFSIAAIAFAAYAVAQSTSVFFTNVPSTFQAGQASTVTFTSTGPVNIILRKGDSNNLATIGTVGSNINGGSFSFTPSSSLASGSDYALEITQGSEINYSQQFTINGAASSTAAYGGASATSASASASGSASGSASAPASASASGSASSSLPVVATPAPSAGIYPMGNSTGPAYGTGAAPYPVPQGTGSPRPASNSTLSTLTPSATSSYNSPTGGSGTSGSSASGSARPSNGAGQVGSSLALIVGAIAAFAYIN